MTTTNRKCVNKPDAFIVSGQPQYVREHCQNVVLSPCFFPITLAADFQLPASKAHRKHDNACVCICARTNCTQSVRHAL